MSTLMHMNKDTSSKQDKVAASESDRTMSTAMHMNKNTSGKKAGKSKRHTEPKTSTLPEITPEIIRCRAYEIFLVRDGRGGDEVSDWLQAERDLSDAMAQPIRDGILV